MITPRRRGFLVVLNSVVRHFGVCVIPVAEIVRMESDARGDYEVMKRDGASQRTVGYFNGLADYACKTADRLRTHYMPNSGIDMTSPNSGKPTSAHTRSAT